MSDEGLSKVEELIREYRESRELLLDSVGKICMLVTKDNVECISALLSDELLEEFIGNAKACHDGTSWWYIGGGTYLEDIKIDRGSRECPYPAEVRAALSDWYASRRMSL